MEKLENVDLAALVTEASDALLTEKRNAAASSIKKHLQRVEQLAIDARKLEKELKNKKRKIS